MGNAIIIFEVAAVALVVLVIILKVAKKKKQQNKEYNEKLKKEHDLQTNIDLFKKNVKMQAWKKEVVMLFLNNCIKKDKYQGFEFQIRADNYKIVIGFNLCFIYSNRYKKYCNEEGYEPIMVYEFSKYNLPNINSDESTALAFAFSELVKQEFENLGCQVKLSSKHIYDEGDEQLAVVKYIPPKVEANW